jgi:hypothetical protein
MCILMREPPFDYLRAADALPSLAWRRPRIHNEGEAAAKSWEQQRPQSAVGCVQRLEVDRPPEAQNLLSTCCGGSPHPLDFRGDKDRVMTDSGSNKVQSTSLGRLYQPTGTIAALLSY